MVRRRLQLSTPPQGLQRKMPVSCTRPRCAATIAAETEKGAWVTPTPR